MTIPRKIFLARISPKRLAANGGRMPFSTIASPRTTIKKKPRTKAERERIYGPEAFQKWFRAGACQVCGDRGHIVIAHTKTGGTGKKASYRFTAQLCGAHLVMDSMNGKTVEGCHNESHRGVKTFEANYHVSLSQLAADVAARWDAECAGGTNG